MVSAEEARSVRCDAGRLYEQYMKIMSPNYQNVSNNKSAANKQSHIKRPCNAFILWSRIRSKEIALERKRNKSEIGNISKRLGVEWRNLSYEERKPFRDEAQRLREQHSKDFPDYKYPVPGFRKKPITKPSLPKIIPCSISDNYAIPNHLDAQTFMDSSQLGSGSTTYVAEGSATPVIPREMPFTPLAPSTYNFDPYCTENSDIDTLVSEYMDIHGDSVYGMLFSPYLSTNCTENRQSKSMSAHNIHQIPSAYQSHKNMHSNLNVCSQAVSRNESVYMNPNNSLAILYRIPESQKNGSPSTHMQVQTVDSQEPASTSRTIFTFPEINTESSSNSLTLAANAFSFEAADICHVALPYASQTLSPPISESFPEGTSSNNLRARPEIPVFNIPPEQYQLIQCVIDSIVMT